MARTRIDPWLTEQPDVIWRQTTLASIIPDLPDFPPNDSQNKTPKKMKVLLPNPSAKSQSETDTASSPDSKHSDHSPIKSKSALKESHNTLSHSVFKKKHKSKRKRKHRSNHEFEAAASKVLAALSKSKLAPVNLGPEPEEYECDPKPKRIKVFSSCSLPDNDSRKNMVPKVVLKDIGKLISKVCPKLASNTQESESETMSGKSPSPSPSRERNLNDRPITPADKHLPKLPSMSPNKISQSLISSMSCDKGKQSLASSETRSSKSPSAPIKSPSRGTNLNKRPVVTPADKHLPRLPAMSPNRISKSLESSMSCDKGKPSLASSEKSFAPFSKKEPTFAALASAAPSFSNSPIASQSSFFWPSSSKLSSAKPIESNSSKTSSSFLSLLPSPPALGNESKSDGTTPRLSRSSSRQPQVTEKLKVGPSAAPTSTRHSMLTSSTSSQHYKSKPSVPLKNGFLGFTQEAGKKSRVCFHVNTNILASSLDLLDLHKNSESSSVGSPTTCPHCNMTFSSVKHCKYHQSFTLADISLVPSRHNNIQENDLWLCPWCPLMATSVMLLNAHKSVCREKDRCHQEEKASSVRKNAPISSSQRNSPNSATLNGTYKSPSKYKVVHGEVIQL